MFHVKQLMTALLGTTLATGCVVETQAPLPLIVVCPSCNRPAPPNPTQNLALPPRDAAPGNAPAVTPVIFDLAVGGVADDTPRGNALLDELTFGGVNNDWVWAPPPSSGGAFADYLDAWFDDWQ